MRLLTTLSLTLMMAVASTAAAQTLAPAATPTPPPPGGVVNAPRPAPQAPLPPSPVAVAGPPRAPEPPRAPGLPGIQSNIKIDLTITDAAGAAPASRKTLTMLVLNGSSGMIRTANRVNGYPVGVDVDAAAQVFQNGAITVRVTFEYTPLRSGDDNASGPRPELHESLTVLLQDGKPLLVSQSMDPVTDRRVTVELTATVLK